MKKKDTFINFLWLLVLIPIGILSCQDCEDCGPSHQEPLVIFKFFNIDSLIKVEDTLLILEDTLAIIDDEIANGNEDLDSIRNIVVDEIDYYTDVSNDIKNGKLKVDEVYGINGEGPLLFKDSLTNDSLSNFLFPLSMNDDASTFIIHIDGMIDTVGLNYLRETDYEDKEILVKAFDLDISSYTYDSAKVICNEDKCYSNETKIYLYF